MTFLTIDKRVIEGNFPRFNRTSTIKPFDRLQVVYNIYTDERPETQAKRDTRSKTDSRELVNLVFLHATCLTKECWEYWIELFFDKYGDILGTVIAFDAVNHGESFVLNRNKLGLTCSWEDGAFDCLKILQSLGIYNNTILIGHSMGGAIALHAAAFNRRVIDSVISIEPVAYSPDNMHQVEQGREAWINLLTKLNKYIKDTFPNEEEYVKYMKRGGIARTLHPRIKEDILRTGKITLEDGTILAIPPREAQLTSYGSSTFSTSSLKYQMKTIDCEVCHVVGASATWNPPGSVKAIRSALPNVVKVDIENGQHMVAMERPEDTFNAIIPFFEKRAAAIRENAKRELEVDPQTSKEREEYYWGTFEKMRKLYTSGKQTHIDRLHRL